MTSPSTQTLEETPVPPEFLSSLSQADLTHPQHFGHWQLLSSTSNLFLDAGLPFSKLLHAVSASVARHLGDTCIIQITNAANQTLKATSCHSRLAAVNSTFNTLVSSGDGVVEDNTKHALTISERVILLPEVKNLKTLQLNPNSVIAKTLVDHPLYSFLHVPILNGAQRIATIDVFRHADGKPFDTFDRDVLVELTRQLGVFFRNAQVYQEHSKARNRAEKRLSQYLRLHHVAEEFTGAESTVALHNILADRIKGILKANAAAVYTLNADASALNLFSSTGIQDEQIKNSLSLTQDLSHPAISAVREKRAFFLESREKIRSLFPDFTHHLDSPNHVALMVLPLTFNNRILGAACLFFADHTSFSQGQRDFANAVAALCAQTIQRSTLGDKTRAFEKESSFLFRTVDQLSSTLGVVARIETVATLAVPHLADCCMVEVVDGEVIEYLSIAHPVSEKKETLEALRRKHAPTCFTGLFDILKKNQPVFYPHVTPQILEQLFPFDEARETVAQFGWQSLIIVPTSIGAHHIACITLATESGRMYTQADFKQAVEFARRASVAVENGRLHHELQNAVQMRDDFLAVAGHELNTPLAALVLQIQNLQHALKNNAPAERLQKGLDKTVRSCARLEQMIGQMLDVARIAGGKLVLQPEVFSLDFTIKELVDRFSELASKAGSEIHFASAGSLRGFWDKSRIEQVISNLISNAIKYGQKNPVRIEAVREGEVAKITVTDHGIGISCENISRIFRRFERLGATREFGGLGLGLWVSRQIVTASGGSLSVESDLGKGASFTVRLPIIQASLHSFARIVSQ